MIAGEADVLHKDTEEDQDHSLYRHRNWPSDGHLRQV